MKTINWSPVGPNRRDASAGLARVVSIEGMIVNPSYSLARRRSNA
jgi:hypothetical protein